MSGYAGIILAGGNGTRLSSLTRTRQHERFYVPALAGAARAVYGRLPSTDLSRHVFQASGESLAVLPVSGVGWNDLGDPARVQATRERIGWELVRA